MNSNLLGVLSAACIVGGVFGLFGPLVALLVLGVLLGVMAFAAWTHER